MTQLTLQKAKVNQIYPENKNNLGQIRHKFLSTRIHVVCNKQLFTAKKKLLMNKLCQLSHKVSLFHTRKLSVTSHTDIKWHHTFVVTSHQTHPRYTDSRRSLQQQSSSVEDGRAQISAYLRSLIIFLSTSRQILRHHFK